MTTDEHLARHGLTRDDYPGGYQYFTGYHARNHPELALEKFGNNIVAYCPETDTWLVKWKKASDDKG